MLKSDLLKALEGVADDEHVFIVSSGYDNEDDMTWNSDTQAEIEEVQIIDGQGFIILDTEEFM